MAASTFDFLALARGHSLLDSTSHGAIGPSMRRRSFAQGAVSHPAHSGTYTTASLDC